MRSVICSGVRRYVDAPRQTSYAGCPDSHYWKLGPATSSGSLILIGRYGETVGE
jgi:hypothetical protein